ncbi:MAG TPA: cohesin domain-containing protein [Blastocatellia bacterium]|nr:cohesin domain-containing protein [Blastocatellia bacterium]
MFKRRFTQQFLVRCLCLAALMIGARDGLAQTRVVVVSAANFSANAIAPESIASAYGVNLATNVVVAETLPLPTSLGGTTVKVNNKPAQLFFVSPGQINFLIPKDAGVGDASIEVTAGNGSVSRDVFRINRVGAAIFTANGNGQGPPAANLLRFRNGTEIPNQPSPAEFDPVLGRFIPKPIDLGPPEDRVFLILFLSGIRNAPDPNADGNVNESVSVVLGGGNFQPAYAGATGLAGLDQINLELPRSLIGRGRVLLSVSSEGIASNQVELVFAPPRTPTPPRVQAISAARYLPGDQVTINGTGFSAVKTENTVRIGGVDAPDVLEASATRLVVRVPFGVKKGKISVSTSLGESESEQEADVKTSYSGLVTDTSLQPIGGILIGVKVKDKDEVTGRTTNEGTFVLPNLEPGNATIRVDGNSIPGLPYQAIPDFKDRIYPNQDTRCPQPITVQSNSAAFASAQNSRARQSAQSQTPTKLTAGDVTLEIPADAQITFPPGVSNRLSLDIVAGSRVPFRLPEAIFSERIVQLTPFGATIKPGAKLTFPNPDGFPAGAQLDLYSFNKDAEVSTQDAFAGIGKATVTADGKQVETAADAVKEASYFFVAARQLRTTAIGRVIDDGRPTSQVIVQVRGQAAFTDGNGGFTPRDASVKQSAQPETLQAEATLQRAGGRRDFKIKGELAKPGGITDFKEINMDPLTRNRPPVLLTKSEITLYISQPAEEFFTAYDPDDGQSVTIEPALVRQGNVGNPNPTFADYKLDVATGRHRILFSPKLEDVGEYSLTITVADNAGDQKLSVRSTTLIRVIGTPGAIILNSSVAMYDPAIPSGPAVQLIWTPAPRAIGYDVIRGVNEYVGRDVQGTSFLDKAGLMAGGSYTYRVVAKNPAGSSPASNEVSAQIQSNICASVPVTVSFDGVTGTQTSGGTITIPVLIGDLTERGVIAYQFELGFDSNVLQFLDADSGNTISNVMTVVTNPSNAGVKVAAFTGAPVGGTGRTLLKLRFLVKGRQGDGTMLRWLKFRLNEGAPIVVTKDNSFTVK